jgi:predicted RecB family nuclease
MTDQASSEQPIVLGSYAAKTCARATHNVYDITVIEPPYEVPESTQRLYDSGNAHEAALFEAWSAVWPDVVNLLHLDKTKAVHVAATLDAMQQRVPVILGGRLPDDVAGGRGGKPDILLFDTVGGGYHPADAKAHFVLSKGNGALVSKLAEPSFADATPVAFGLRNRGEADVLQLAHYWRMLEACGHNAASARGAIVGNDPTETFQLTWYDLNEPMFKTFSRTNGTTGRSPLERHDHEHAFRVKVAQRARQRKGEPNDPPPLVEPLGQDECDGCRWAPACVDVLPAGDLSRELRGALSVREYLALRRAGIATIDELVAADVDALLDSNYADETTNVVRRTLRLQKARVAAELVRDGDVLRLIPGAPIEIPSAAVEIDIDTEWDRQGRVYLWGLLVTADGESKYVAFSDPSALDADGELAIARQCFDWLAATHPDALIFHYTAPEPSHARRILGDAINAYAGTAAGLEGWHDLYRTVVACMESRSGLGLKVVATEAAGFHWQDETPGGLESQDWLEEARAGDTGAWQRILTYNEDDVRATLAVRRFLRTNR